MSEQSAEEFWEARYAGAGPIWSGRVNPAVADLAAGFTPGTALDLGCGEGGDVIWLAQHGWRATGVDVAQTAVDRATRAAADAGVPAARIRFVAANLTTWQPDASFDLVTASFLHSPVELPRIEILRRAAGMVASGGHLLLVSHAAFPPWRRPPGHHDHEHDAPLPTPSDEYAELALDPSGWVPLLVETRVRDAVGPSGEAATLEDAIILARRD